MAFFHDSVPMVSESRRRLCTRVVQAVVFFGVIATVWGFLVALTALYNLPEVNILHLCWCLFPPGCSIQVHVYSYSMTQGLVCLPKNHDHRTSTVKLVMQQVLATSFEETILLLL